MVVRPGAPDVGPALAMVRPCWSALPDVAPNLKVSEFQAQTGAGHPCGQGTHWDGTQTTEMSLGLWDCLPVGKKQALLVTPGHCYQGCSHLSGQNPELERTHPVRGEGAICGPSRPQSLPNSHHKKGCRNVSHPSQLTAASWTGLRDPWVSLVGGPCSQG